VFGKIDPEFIRSKPSASFAGKRMRRCGDRSGVRARVDLAAVDALALALGVVPCGCGRCAMSGADPAARRLPQLSLDPDANRVPGSIAPQPVGETPERHFGSLIVAGDSRWSGRDRSSISGLHANRSGLHRGQAPSKPGFARTSFGLRSSFPFSKVIL